MIKGKITMENGEIIPFELYEEDAPGTVANFVKLVKEGYYDGKTFHRGDSWLCLSGRMPERGRHRRSGIHHPLRDQRKPAPAYRWGPCPWRTEAAIPAAASFFIVHEPQPHLDGVHTVFGQVTDNLQAVRQMRNGDVMKSVTIDEA